MTWTLSHTGEKLGAQAGIHELMRDLGAATSGRSDVLMLGGGNPAHIPEVEKIWRERWSAIAAEEGRLENILGDYDAPAGSPAFVDALVESLKTRFGWDIHAGNVAVVNGSQNAFFYLFNMLGGRHNENHQRRILLPMAPEYIGYADQALSPRMFESVPARYELIGDHRFKYYLDLDRLNITPDTAALCVSRPTNPTGNVLTGGEIDALEALAARRHIPLIIDNAYGSPFPDIIFNDAQPLWTENTILVMSLSKLGLPGTRTGIILAREDLIESISVMHAVVGLANGNIGQAIAAPLLADGRLYEISQSIIRPFYEQRSHQVIQWIDDAFDADLPYRVHVSEGAMFLWLWFDGLPITSEELYQRLKKRGVVVVPGHYFFYGLEEPHPHEHNCIRLSYAQAPGVVQRGVAILAEEVKKAYQLVTW